MASLLTGVKRAVGSVVGGMTSALGGSKGTYPVTPGADAGAGKPGKKVAMAAGTNGKGGGSSNSDRRKTTTVRRPAVSTETSAAKEDGELVMSKKSDEVTKQLLAYLKELALFENLSPELLNLCIDAMQEKSVGVGEAVIKHGDRGDDFYIVYTGTFEAFLPKGAQAELDRRAANRAAGTAADADAPDAAEATLLNERGEKILQVYNPGEGFGELALLYNSPRAASVRMISPSDGSTGMVYALGRAAFRQLVLEHNTKTKHGLELHLKKVEILQDLTQDEFARIADAMELIDFAADEYIVEKGQDADSLYLILSGEVVCHEKAKGDEGAIEELMRLSSGDSFGESALNSTEAFQKRQANVVAVGPVRVGKLKAADLELVCGRLANKMWIQFSRKCIQNVKILVEALSADQIEKVLRELEMTTVAAGETIIHEGKEGTNFYIIATGSVEVRKEDKVVAKLGVGDHFGEHALLTSEKTAATVVATENTQLLSLNKSSFERVMPPLQDILERVAHEREMRAEREARPAIHYKDLKLITVLGEGTFGRVRLVSWGKGKEKQAFALKTLQKGQLIHYKQVEHCVNEKRLLGDCFHPFILKLEATYSSRNQVYMLLEVALGGELFTYLRSEGKFGLEKATLYAAMVTSAFAYLHARKIAHRDLKPENLLFDPQGYLKLVDFGFAKAISDRTWTLCGTPEYLAPEIIANKGHNCGVDWWTLGILLYEMLVGEPPFVGASQLDTYQKISRGKYRMPTSFEPVVKNAISRLLMHAPTARLGCTNGGPAEVLGHPLFDGLSFAELEKKKLPMPHVPKIKDAFDASNFDEYSDDDGAEEWFQFNTPKYDALWKEEFGAPIKG